MSRINTRTAFLISILFLCLSASAQVSDRKTRRDADNADKLFSAENYWEALPLYKSLADANPSSVKYNNRTGICYFFSPHKTKCISYFEQTIKDWGTDTIPEVYYYLGTAYQMQNQFDKAIYCFTMVKKSVKPLKNSSAATSDYDRAIEMCNNGKRMVGDPTSVRILNLGPTVNTFNREYAPVISADESKLIFTSRRKEGTGRKTTPEGYYYEDIYIAEKLSEGWQVQSLDSTYKKEKHPFYSIFFSKARNIGSSLNTKYDDAAISLTPDGKTLFLYRDEFIWQSTYDGSKWTKPVALNDNINEKRSFQPSCSITADGKSLYIVSDRPGGMGGKDIYVSKKTGSGDWGPCVNLGETINTEYDEDSPFITPDGKTLYFSSQGHNSMGGYDIFKSELKEGKWSTPENLGYPTNTGADDIFFVMNANQTRGYFSSVREDTYGDDDIYVLYFVPQTFFYAAVKEGNDLKPVATTVKAKGTTSSEDSISYAGSKIPGRYSLALLAPDKYNMTIETEGYKPHSVDVKLPNQNYKKPFYQEVNYQTVLRSDGKPLKQLTTIYSAFFDIDSVVKADPTLSQMRDHLAAYSALVKKLDPNTSKLNFSVSNFSDQINPELPSTPEIASNSGKSGQPDNSGKPNTSGTSGTSGTSVEGSSSTSTKPTSLESKIDTSTRTTGTLTAAESSELRTFAPIQFDFAKNDLKDEEKAKLDDLCNYLKENKELKLKVSGHTDSKGSDQYNQVLSLKRAKAAADYVTSKGIDPHRLSSVGYGKRQPIAPNENPDKSDNAEGRQKNRRVEFKVFVPKPAPKSASRPAAKKPTNNAK